MIARFVALGAAVAFALAPAGAHAAQPPHPFAGNRQVTLMTQNLYLGTDLRPIFAAPTPVALLGAVAAGWQQVLANDFPSRAEAIAKEIAAAEPDLVALQEATLYRTDFPPDGAVTPADAVALDFVAELSGALARRGLHYGVASSFSGTDAELPAGLPPSFDLRLTDRIVILARTDESTAHLKVSNPQAGVYDAALTVPTVAGPLTLPRGWASVDVKIRGREFRFVTTHLEAFSPLVRNAQATELVAASKGSELPLVVVGDFNSGPGVDLDAYTILLGGGLSDASGSSGPTCCFGTDLHDGNATLTKRIDLVLTRGPVTPVSTDVVGDDAGDRTADGLWPSDHAGVVATLEVGP